MQKKQLMKISGYIFAVVGTFHAARLFFHYNIIIADWLMPEWLSLVVGLLLLTLSVLILKNK
ncbi:MAG: hypothetical protein VX198_03430 [Pseudomonadota bacterium]|nr:hypothetical protein [Pseudomonadota bacterium]MED5338973.1 hypothetical protein [Pseudomonadota bacterium]MEE3207151.1 hypothetical protein [Pseudomonadota bacterium]MEE3260819.1 hypothetical protein [Pseudomonadota bacterium]